MFWKNWSWPIRILAGLGLGVVAAITVFPIFAHSRESSYPSCQSNLKRVGLAFLQYRADYDGHLPLVAVGNASSGWANSIQTYLKSTQVFQYPQEGDQGQSNPRLNKYTDYWYNAQLSGRNQTSLDDLALQILSGDGDDLTDARYSIFAAPAQWIHDLNSPSHRHYNEQANYLFADGHVKMLETKELLTNPNGARSFFMPKSLSSH